MFVKHFVREKIAGAPEPFRRGGGGRELGQLERHIAAAIEHRQQIEYIRFSSRFVQRNAEGLRVEHAQVDAEVFRHTNDLARIQIVMRDRDRIKKRRVSELVPEALEARGEATREPVHVRGNRAQAIRPVIAGVHR